MKLSAYRTRAARFATAGFRRRRPLIALFLLAFLCGARGAARANIALVLEPSLEGGAADDKTKLLAGVKSALKAQRLALADSGDRDAAIAGEPQLRDCYSALCMERLGRVLGVQVVLHLMLKQEGGAGKERTYKLSAEVLDVDVGAVGAQKTEACVRCSVEQAAQKLGELLGRVIEESRNRPRGTLEVVSTPAGASVFVDGTELGVTPYKRAAFAGEHKLVLRHVGFRSEQVDVVVEDGQKQKIERKLASGADPAPVIVMEKAPVYKKWWFWVALGGAAVVAAGVTAGVVIGTRSTPTTMDRTLPSNTFSFQF